MLVFIFEVFTFLISFIFKWDLKNAFTLNLLHRRSSSLWPQEGTEDSLKMPLLQFVMV